MGRAAGLQAAPTPARTLGARQGGRGTDKGDTFCPQRWDHKASSVPARGAQDSRTFTTSRHGHLRVQLCLVATLCLCCLRPKLHPCLQPPKEKKKRGGT